MDNYTYEEAAKETTETRHQLDVIKYNLTLRDWIQSLFGNRIPPDHPLLLELLGLIPSFNAAGPVLISSVEGPSGAQPQVDVMCGRSPLGSIRATNKALQNADDLNTEIRLLVRGPFGVGLKALHENDLEKVLTKMAEAAGARKGRPVVFKLFEAQNNPVEYLATLQILSRLRKQGINVACEVSFCYTADKDFNATYFEAIARELLFDDRIDPAIVRRVGIKDMTGYAHSGCRQGRLEEGNAAQMMHCLMPVLRDFKDRRGINVEFELEAALHTHEPGQKGQAVGANVAASKAVTNAIREANGNPPVSALVVDVIPGGRAFADMLAVMQRNADEGHGPQPSEKQIALARQMEGLIKRLETFYSYTTPAAGLWTDDQLYHARLPGGAVTAAYTAAVLPTITALRRKYPAINEAAAKRLAADLFVHINRRIARDNGNASSVTPGAKHIYTLTNVVMQAMVQEGFVEEINTQGIDLTALTPTDKDGNVLGGELPWTDRIAKSYNAIETTVIKDNNAAVYETCEYFRSRMPMDVHNDLLTMYARLHLEKILPEKPPEDAALMIPHEKWEEFRSALLANVTNKERAKALRMAWGASEAEAAAFVAEHIGVNVLRRDAKAVEVWDVAIERVRQYAKDYKKHLSLERIEDLAFAAIIMGGINPETKVFSDDVRRQIKNGTSNENPAAWASNFVDWGKVVGDAQTPADKVDPLVREERIHAFLRSLEGTIDAGTLAKRAKEAAVIWPIDQIDWDALAGNDNAPATRVRTFLAAIETRLPAEDFADLRAAAEERFFLIEPDKPWNRTSRRGINPAGNSRAAQAQERALSQRVAQPR